MPKKSKKFADMPTNFLMCRAFHRHPWEAQVTFKEKRDRRLVYVTELLCTSCKAEVTILFFPTTGEMRRGTPRYPNNYLLEDIKAWGGRSLVLYNSRLELFERLSK